VLDYLPTRPPTVQRPLQKALAEAITTGRRTASAGSALRSTAPTRRCRLGREGVERTFTLTAPERHTRTAVSKSHDNRDIRKTSAAVRDSSALAAPPRDDDTS
jgi:hypothetical protein